MASFIVSYSNQNVGFAQELSRHFIRRRADFYLLLHPLEPSQNRRSTLQEYRGGELIRETHTLSSPPLVPLHYMRCLWSTTCALVAHARELDLVVACSNVDTLPALVLRLLMSVKVVHLSTDFAVGGGRFKSGVLNTIYSFADRAAYRWSTVVWHMYPEQGRLKPYKHRTRSYDILDGNNFRRVHRLPLEAIQRHRLVYIGQINRACGLEEAIRAVADLRPEFADVGLDLISSGDPVYEQRLRHLASELALGDAVTFHGQIRDPQIYEPILARCGVGLCLYELNSGDFAWYGTPLKVYLYGACGLPVVVSDSMGPHTLHAVNQIGIGRCATKGRLREVLRELFRDPDGYAAIRQNAIAWAAQFDWEDKFDRYLALLDTVELEESSQCPIA